jgi:hypothetical protein
MRPDPGILYPSMNLNVNWTESVYLPVVGFGEKGEEQTTAERRLRGPIRRPKHAL